MLAILFLSLMATITFMYFYFTKQINSLRQQVFVLNLQKDKLKNLKKKLCDDSPNVESTELPKD